MGVKLNIKTIFFYIIAYYYFIRVKPLIESITLLCEVGSRSKFKKTFTTDFFVCRKLSVFRYRGPPPCSI